MTRRFDVKRLDDVIHGRLRLGVVAYLAKVEAADFNELKALLDTTAGNLSVHLRKLEDAGYVAVEKGYISRKPLTRLRITKAGRDAFQSYLGVVTRLLESHAESQREAGAAQSRAGSRERRRKSA